MTPPVRRTLRGGSWNLRVGRNPDVVARQVLALLRQERLDFLAVCEAGDYADHLDDDLPGYSYVVDRRDASAQDSGVIVKDSCTVDGRQLHRLERVGWERRPGRVGLHWPRSAVSVEVDELRVLVPHLPPGPFAGRYKLRGKAFSTSLVKLRRIFLRWQKKAWVAPGDWNMHPTVVGSNSSPSPAWLARKVKAHINGDGIDYVLSRNALVRDYQRHEGFGTSDHSPISFTVTY